MEALGWAADFRQLECGAEQVNVSALKGGDIDLMRVEFGNRVHQLAISPHGYTTFGLPTGPQAPGRFGRRLLESETLNCFHPVTGLDVVSPRGFSAYTIAIKTSRLVEAAMLLESSYRDDLEAMWGIQFAPDARPLAQLRRSVVSALSITGSDTVANEVKKAAWREVQADLPLSILKACRFVDRLPYVPKSTRNRALKRALDYIHDSEGQVISIERLCKEACCSLSTLERAFAERFSVTPKQYLTFARMCSVRRQLLNNNEARPIAGIAADLGFWHMSKFAADYRKFFGELPSQTRGLSRPVEPRSTKKPP